MLILILIVCIVIAIICALAIKNFKKEVTLCVSAIILVASTVFGTLIIATIFTLAYNSAEYSAIDKKIEMYQKENREIESQIDELVKNYMKYETETFKDFKTESSVAMVSLYPELKSDTLVKSQIETYTKNNNKIKGLKEDKIMRSVYRWWLYFGR